MFDKDHFIGHSTLLGLESVTVTDVKVLYVFVLLVSLIISKIIRVYFQRFALYVKES